MKKETKQILLIILFFIAGSFLGFLAAETQANQLSAPEYTALFTSHNMPVPETMDPVHIIAGMGLLFSGTPTGLMFFQNLSKKWLTSTAPKILIGFITWPIYILIGAVGSIPFIIYKIIILIRRKR